jgi:dCTP deaminase
MEHGQIVGRLIYSPMLARPEKIYGAQIVSSYQMQGLALNKQFKRWP